MADLSISEQIRPSVEIAYGHEVDTAGDGRSSHRKSFVSNIFDYDSSLSQGVGEYVTSKIAEALAEHDRAHRSNVDARANSSVHITIKVDGAGDSHHESTAMTKLSQTTGGAREIGDTESSFNGSVSTGLQ